MKGQAIVAVSVFAFAGCGGSPSAPAQAASGPSAQAPRAAPTVLPAVPSAALQAAIDASDRSDKDRALDAGRHPAQLLAFAGITPGMRVAELGAGGGYTTEILARGVGPTGTVFGENTKWALERYAAQPWSERLAKPALKNVVRVDRELDDPLPPEAKDLDAVFVVLVYHDMVWLGADRDKMNRAVLAALKHGGEYIVEDHSAKDGSGLKDVQTLHRIDEQAVVDEVTRAGFTFAGEGDFLRNPTDARDWNDSPLAAADRRGKSDRFVLKFVRP